MGSVLDQIDESLAAWLVAQPLFFVATAPLAGDGLVNCSPKGMAGTLTVLGPRRVAYLDLTGSGIETIAHLRENGRIVLMVCAFEGRPRIIRLHGTGTVVRPGDAEFAHLLPHFSTHPGVRSIVVIDVVRVSDSCGYAVPQMSYQADRDVLDLHNAKLGDDGVADYQATRNAHSLDGLPGLPDLPSPEVEGSRG
jgi:hypothetical protein